MLQINRIEKINIGSYTYGLKKDHIWKNWTSILQPKPKKKGIYRYIQWRLIIYPDLGTLAHPNQIKSNPHTINSHQNLENSKIHTKIRDSIPQIERYSQKGKRKITNENETFVRLGLALHTAEELRHEIHGRYIIQIRGRRHFEKWRSPWEMGDGREVEGGSVCWRFFSLLEFLVVRICNVSQILPGLPCI